MNHGETGIAPKSSAPDPGDSDGFCAVARRIEANPLGRLMYGQRELFHSNLIAWFFDELPDAADAVFRPLSRSGTDTGRWADRERGHMDIVFHWPDRAPVVIENKVFSLPRRDQLDEYQAATTSWVSPPALVLLSVSAPDFDLGEWRFLSYREFARHILAALPDVSTYEVETMRRYAALIEDLHQLVSAVDIHSEDEPVWLPETLLDAISSSQMRAALRKARAQRVAQVINDFLPGLEQPAGSGMSNSTPLVEALEYVYTQGIHAHLGWQLQGAQFRRAVAYHDPSVHGHSQESRRQREALSRDHPQFFSLPKDLPQARGGRKEFNHFAPNFVYNYVKTPRLTIAELKSAAREVHEQIEDLRAAEPSAEARPQHAIRRAP